MRKLLRELSELPGPSGLEEAAQDRIAAVLNLYCDSVHRDALGNCIGVKSGEGPSPRPRVLLAAHMDEIGLIITRIEDGGFLRFAPVGGIDPRALLAQEVTVLTDPPLFGYVGVKPPHLMDSAERERAVPIEDMFIDVGLPEADVRRRVPVGTPVVVRRPFTNLLGTRATGKALDNRAGVCAMLEAARLLSGLRFSADVYFVATVQEEVGLRGAITSAYRIVPDMAIAVDVGFGEAPGLPEDQVIGVGKGPAIALGPNVHPRLHERLVQTAREHGIPHQIEPMPGSSGTDAWAMQVSRSGVPTAVVSIPLRYMHTAAEVVDLEDIRQTARLLALFAAGLTASDKEGWSRALA
ncbi:MAG: M42 family metallopeptidase [Firmicutes bacterium]|nr:M42 family metallopeptidase [Bacillota bacterium]